MAIRIGIVGGGVAGVTAAQKLGELGLNVTLFEKNSSLVSGPPFCHLHAGGNLYREIPDKQCIELLEQSIDFAKYYPYIIDKRPTVISVPLTDAGDPKDLLPRLKMLKGCYTELVENDVNNSVLGSPENYYKLYSRQELEKLSKEPLSKQPENDSEWMIPFAKYTDLDKIKFPVILVREYGLNLFRLAAGAKLKLETLKNVKIYNNTEVKFIEKEGKKWRVYYIGENDNESMLFDYLINGAGFRTAEIDNLIGVCSPGMIEFKAAYVTKWEGADKWPEVIFHGERGTPEGMGQFTPYPGGHFQLHGMTKDITLFEGGLALAPSNCTPPKLGSKFIEKIEYGWRREDIEARTNAAIKHISKFIPSFSKAKKASVPLYGAQQIPGNDITLRVAEVSFPVERYARCEIVKVSSTLDMVDEIIKNMKQLGLIEESKSSPRALQKLELDKNTLSNIARQIASERNYPEMMGEVCVD